jgi:hypothetical protein
MNDILEKLGPVIAWVREADPDHADKIEQLSRTGDEADFLKELGKACARYHKRLPTWGAVKIRSMALGGQEVWLVGDPESAEAVRHEGLPLVYTKEIPYLLAKGPVQLSDIFRCKSVFPEAWIVQ